MSSTSSSGTRYDAQGRSLPVPLARRRRVLLLAAIDAPFFGSHPLLAHKVWHRPAGASALFARTAALTGSSASQATARARSGATTAAAGGDTACCARGTSRASRAPPAAARVIVIVIVSAPVMDKTWTLPVAILIAIRIIIVMPVPAAAGIFRGRALICRAGASLQRLELAAAAHDRLQSRAALGVVAAKPQGHPWSDGERPRRRKCCAIAAGAFSSRTGTDGTTAAARQACNCRPIC